MPKTAPSPGLRVRKLADKTTGDRVARYDPFTGERMLVNPETANPNDLADIANWRHEPWPLAGLQVEGDAPTACQLPTRFVNTGVAEGWLTLEGEEIVHRPGGPPEDLWRVTHTFRQATAIVLHTVDGDVRYRVVYQPDKYVDPRDPAEFGPRQLEPRLELTAELAAEPVTPELYAAAQTHVAWEYVCELEEA